MKKWKFWRLKNRNFGQKYKLWSKVEILVENWNYDIDFQRVNFFKNRFWPKYFKFRSLISNRIFFRCRIFWFILIILELTRIFRSKRTSISSIQFLLDNLATDENSIFLLKLFLYHKFGNIVIFRSGNLYSLCSPGN